MGMVFVVAVSVTLVFTVAASVFEQFHQVAAEELRGKEETAVPGAGQTQVLTLKEWGVTLSVPMGPGLPAVKYVSEGPDSYGLSSADVEKAGSACSAAQNAIGTIVRVPAGTWGSRPGQVELALGTV
ncbi:MAG TPA: hypothetical protein VHQ86_01885, partial [Candidatus Saccharimonadia bacterium]|nr:hypothetical protein [Candidatus Saccharimonadia bacterium]